MDLSLTLAPEMRYVAEDLPCYFPPGSRSSVENACLAIGNDTVRALTTGPSAI